MLFVLIGEVLYLSSSTSPIMEGSMENGIQNINLRKGSIDLCPYCRDPWTNKLQWSLETVLLVLKLCFWWVKLR